MMQPIAYCIVHTKCVILQTLQEGGEMDVQQKKLGSSKTLASYVVSYVVILVLPLLLSLAFLFAVKAEFRTQMARINDTALRQAADGTHAALDAAFSALFRLSESNGIQKLYYIHQPFTSAQRVDIFTAMREDMLLAGSAMPMDCSFHIYFVNGEFLLNHRARYSPELAYEQLFAQSGLSYAEYQALLSSRHAQDIIDMGDSLLLMQSYPYTGNVPVANMLAILPKAHLEEIARQNEWIAAGHFSLANAAGDVLFSYGTGMGGQAAYHSQLAGEYGLTYALEATGSGLSGAEGALTMAYLFFLGAALAVGLMLAAAFTLRRYRPIARIAETIESAHPPVNADRKDELAYIDLSVRNILSANAQMQQQVLARNEYMRQSYLSQILSGRIKATELDGEALAEHLLKFDQEYFLVFLLTGQNHEPLNVSAPLLLSECMNRAYRAYACPVREYAACVVNFSQLEEAPDIEKEFRQAQKEIERQLGTATCAALSNPHASYVGLYNGYEEARYAAELASNEAFRVYSAPYEEIKYGYSGDMEKALSRAIGSGDREEAHRLLNDIFVMPTGIKLSVMRYVAYDVQNSILRIRESMGLPCDGANAPRQAEAINTLHSAQEIVAYLEGIAQPAFAQAEAWESNQNTLLIEKICAFVEQHYGEENLSNTLVADAMGISPSYLSRVFKQSTGAGLLDYISNLRVQRACDLFLSEPETSVKAVCDQVGYGNLTTFTRVFKKHTGLTPGQYKLRALNTREREK